MISIEFTLLLMIAFARLIVSILDHIKNNR